MKPWRVTNHFSRKEGFNHQRLSGRTAIPTTRARRTSFVQNGIIAMFIVVLSGCAGSPSQTASISAPSPAATEEKFIFRVLSRVVIRPNNGGAAKQFSIVWTRLLRGEEVHDNVLVKNPLGATEARLTRSPHQAVLERQGKKTTAENAAALSQQMLGYALPIDSFGYWIVGVSNPYYSTSEKILPGGEIIEILQNDWEVDYAERDDDNRPKKINLNSATARIEVDVKKWLTP